MAPGRKRGGRGSKAKCGLTLGDLVLAKVKGFPAWPAKISRPEDWDRTDDPKKFFVQFFGTAEIAYIAPPDIQKYTTEVKNKVLARCKSKTIKHFTQAVEEINEAFEELERRKSSGEREDTDDVEVDDNVEIDSKDNIVTGEFNGDRCSNGLDDDVTRPECSSPLQEKVDYQDANSSISCDIRDGLSPLVSNDDAELPLTDEDKGYLSAEEEPFCNNKTKENAVQNSPYTLIRSSSHLDLPNEETIDGSNSKKVSIKSKKKSNRTSEDNKVNDKTSLASSENIKQSKPKKRRREESAGNKKEKSPPIVKPRDDSIGGKKAKRIVEDAKGDSKGKDQAKVSGRKDKRNLVSDETTRKVKRSKYEDKDIDSTKIFPQTAGIVNQETDDVKTKQSRLQVKTENELDSNVSGDEDDLPPLKRRRRRVPEVLSEEKKGKSCIVQQTGGSCSDKVKSPSTKPVSKRRAVLLDDSDDEADTSVPVVTTTRVCASVNVSESDEKAHVKTEIHHKPSEGVSGETGSKEKVLSISQQNVETPKNALISPTNLKSESGKVCSETYKSALVSPRKSTLVISSTKPKSESGIVCSKKDKSALVSPVKPTLVISPIKPKSELGKVCSKKDKSALVSPRKSTLVISPTKPKSESGKVCSKKDKSALGSPRKSTLVVEPLKAKSPGKVSINATHKKIQTGYNNGHIAASNGSSKSQIQAGNGKSKPSSSVLKQKISTISTSRSSDFTPVAGELLESSFETDTDDKANSLRRLIEVAKKRQADAHSTPLSGDVPPHLLGTTSMQLDLRTPSSHINSEILVEKRVGSGHRLGGGTDAAAARIAFEGSVDSLSRTKDSIGRATRLAIDCAKFGIADEVIELLIRKMEFEPSSSRRVDLFFLVDSILSHGHKGGSGQSYIPSVEAALPRLLGAAAPSGVHENRRQCHKVLRLWVHRKIFPESLLRRHMDELKVPKVDLSAVIFQKRSSRSERSIDDPVREMEGMLVDEYGSNAAFHGLLSSCLFEEDEEEEEEDVGKVSGIVEGSTPKDEEGETICPPNDRRPFVLEDVDGELEMEDVSAPPSEEQELRSETLTSTTAEHVKLEEEKKVGSTPPLPEGSPPRTPPIPCSTSPPPLQHQLPLPPPPPLSTLPPHLHPSSSSSTNFSYHSIPHDPNVNQLNHMPQRPPCILPPPPPPQIPPLPQNGFQPLTPSQFSYSVPPRVHQYPHPPPLPHPPPQQHQYPPPYSLPPPPNHHHHHPYHHNGPRHYVPHEDQWRMMPPNNFNHNAPPAAVWHNGPGPSSINAPFAPEGYFRPPPPPLPPPTAGDVSKVAEKQSFFLYLSTLFFQKQMRNKAFVVFLLCLGPGVPQMIPCRPDMPSQGCWRPA